MGRGLTQTPSFSVIFLGIPHTPSCGLFHHICVGSAEPTGGDSALPQLHTDINDIPDIYRYPYSHKYRDGMWVWVDGWGRVKLVEKNVWADGLRYFACVKGGREVCWVRVPIGATLMRAREGDEPVRRRVVSSISL